MRGVCIDINYVSSYENKQDPSDAKPSEGESSESTATCPPLRCHTLGLGKILVTVGSTGLKLLTLVSTSVAAAAAAAACQDSTQGPERGIMVAPSPPWPGLQLGPSRDFGIKIYPNQ